MSLLARFRALIAGLSLTTCLLTGVGTANADTFIWDTGVTGFWNVGTNWSTDVVPVSSDTTSLIFGTGAAMTVTNDIADPFVLNSLTLTSNVNGAGITMNGGALVFAGANALITASTNTATASAINNNIIIGGSGLRITGVGSVGMGLVVAGSISTTGSGAVTLTLDGSATGAGANFLNVTGLISDGSGTLGIVKTGASRWLLSNAGNSFTGGLTIQQGLIRMANVGALGNGLIHFGNSANNNVTLEYVGTAAISLTKAFNLGSTGLASITSSTTGLFTVTNTIGFDGNGTRVMGVGGNGTALNDFQSLLTNNTNDSSAVGFQKDGTSTWIVSNSGNTFTGGVTISGGQLRAADVWTNLNLTNNNLRFNAAAATFAALETSGTLTSSLGTGAGQIQFLNGGGFSALGGALTVTLNNDATTPIDWGTTAGATKLSVTTELNLNGTLATDVVTLHNAFTLFTGSHIIRVNDNTTTTNDRAVLAGVINGSGGIQKVGAGVLELTGANTFTGGITINAGTVRAGSATPLGTNNIRFNATAGTLALLETNGTLTQAIGAGVNQINWSNVNATNGGAGGFSALGDTLTVALNNNITVPLVWSTNTTAGATGLFMSGIGEMQLNSIYSTHEVNVQNAIDLNAGTRTFRVQDNVTTTNDLATLSGTLSNGGLLKAGTGLLVLSGTNAFTGGITITGGVVRGNDSVINLNVQPGTGNRVTFQGTAASPTVLETKGTLTNSIGTGVGQFHWTNVTHSTQSNSTSGGFSAFGGALDISFDNNLTPLAWNVGTTASGGLWGTGELQLGSIYSNNVVTIQNSIQLANGTRTFRVTDNPDSLNDYAVLAGVISSTTPGSGALTKQGNGILQLNSDNLYTGATVISGGTLRLGNGLTGSGSVAGNVTNNSNLVFSYGSGFTKTVAGVISGTGSVEVNAAGSTIFFTQAQTYTGTTTITAGTVKLGAGVGLGATSKLVLNNTSTLDLNGLLVTVAGLSDGIGGGGTIINTSTGLATLTVSSTTINSVFNGTINQSSGTIQLNKAGAGTTLTLGGVNNYTGGTTLVAGTIVILNDSAFGTGTLRLAGGTMDFGAGDHSYNNPLALAGTATVTAGGNLTFTNTVNAVAAASVVTFSNGGTTTLNGLSMAANLTVGGSPLTITGQSAVTAVTILTNNAATSLVLNNLTLLASLTAAGTGTVQVNGLTQVNAASAISNNGATPLQLSTLNLGAATTFGGTGQIDVNGLTQVTAAISITNNLATPMTFSNEVRLGANLSLTTGAQAFNFLGGLSVTGTTPGVTMVVRNAGAATIDNGINLSLDSGVAHNLSFNVTSANTNGLIVNGPIVDGGTAGGAITVVAGTVSLLGSSSTYSGGTTLTAGTLNIGSNTSLGTGTLRVTAGTLNVGAGDRVLSNPFNLNGTFTVTGGGNITFTGLGNSTAAAAVVTLANTGTVAINGLALPANLTLPAASTAPLTILGDSVASAAALVITNSTAASLTFENLRLDGAATTFAGLQPTFVNGALSLSGGNRALTVSTVGGSTINNLHLAADGIGRILSVTATTPVTINGLIEDGGFGGGLIVVSGAVTLNNATNTYSGGTTLTAGTLNITNTGSIGTGNLFVNGGIVAPVSGTLANNVVIGASHTWSGSGINVVFDASGNNAVNVTSTITNNMASLAFMDAVNWNAAGLTVVGSGQTSFTGGLILQTAGTQTLTIQTAATPNVNVGDINLGVAGLNLRTTGGLIVNGVISGSSAIGITFISGSNTFNGANTYGGVTTFATTAGTLTIGNIDAFGNSSVVINGGTIFSNASGNIDNTLTFGGNLTLNGPGQALTFDGGGVITITAAAVITNNVPTVTFSDDFLLGANLTLAGAAPATVAGALTLTGGDRTFTASATGGQVLNNINLSADGVARTLSLAGTTPITVSGVVANGAAASGLNILSGSVILNNANTYSGGTTLTAGTTTVGDNAAFGTGGILVAGGSVLAADASARTLTNAVTLGAGLTLNSGAAGLTLTGVTTLTGAGRTITLAGTGPITLSTVALSAGTDVAGARALTLGGAAQSTLTVSGVIGNGGNGSANGVILNLTHTSALVTFDATNTYTGNTTITSGALFATSFTNAVGAGALLFNGAAATPAVFQTAGTLALNTSSSAAPTAGTASWVASGGFAAKGGNLTVSLNGGATQAWATGGFVVGELQLGANTADGTVTFANSMTFGTNANRTIRVLDGSAAVDAIVSGNMTAGSGTAALTKQGAGTLVITGASVLPGGTIVSGGTLRIGDGTLTTATTGSSALTIGAGATAVFDRPIDTTQPTIVGNGTLVQNQNFTLLTNTVTFTGTANILTGTLKVGSGGVAFYQAASTALGTGAKLHLDTASNLTVNQISGGGDVIFNPVTTAAFTIVGDISTTGNVTLGGATAGTLVRIGNGVNSGSGSIAGNISMSGANATLVFNRPDDYTYAGSISGTGLQIRKLNNSTLTISGNNTFSTPVSIDAGTVVVTGTFGSGGAVSVGAASTVRGIGGTAGGTYTFDNSTLEVGGVTTNTVSQFTLGGLVLNSGAVINLDLQTAATSSATLVDLLSTIGDRIVVGTTPVFNAGSINLTALSGLNNGSYLLFSGYSGMIANPLLPVLPGYQVTTHNMDGYFFVDIFQTITRTWRGNISGTWDSNITANWAGDTVYNDADVPAQSVRFDDTATGTTNVIISNGGSVSPNDVTVDNSTLNYVFSGDAIAGIASLSKMGTGTLTLLNNNTFTGAINIGGGGTLQLGNNGTSGSITPTISVALDGNSTFAVNRLDALSLSNGISGTGTFRKSGDGTLDYAGVGSYFGSTVVNGGTLALTGAGVLPDTAVVSINSGTLNMNSSVAHTFPTVNMDRGQIDVSSAAALAIANLTMTSGTLNVTGANLTLTTVNLGGLTNTTGSPSILLNLGSSRQLALMGNLTFSANNDPLTDVGGIVIQGAGTVSLTAPRTFNISDSANAAVELTVASNIVTPTSAFIKTGSGALYLQGTNASTQLNTLSAGTLIIGGGATLGTNTLVATGGILQADGTARTMTNNIALIGNLTISGSSNLSITGATSGVIVNHTGNRTLTVNNTTTVRVLRLSESTTTVSRTLTVAGSGTLIVGAAVNETSSSTLSSLVVDGNGLTLDLLGNGNYGGSTTIRQGTVLISNALSTGTTSGLGTLITGTSGAGAGAAALLTSGSTPFTLTRDITVVAGTAGASVTLGGNSAITTTFSGPITFSQNVNLTATAGGTVVFTGVLDDVGTFGINKTGDGTVVLTNNNTFSGPSTISSGTLRIGNGGVTGTIGSTSIFNNGLIILDRSDDIAFNGSITGVGALQKLGAGMLTLGGNNTYTGATTISGGTFKVLGDFASSYIDVGGNILQFDTAGTQTISGIINGTGTLQKLGSGTTALTAMNTFSGTTSVEDGTLLVDNALGGTIYVNGTGNFLGSGVNGSTVIFAGGSGTISGTQTGTTNVNTGSVTVTNGGDLAGDVNVGGGQLTVVGGMISGDLTQTSGTVNINTGAVTSGALNVSGGSFFVNNGGSASSTPGINVGSGATLNVNTGSISGNGTITVSGNIVVNGDVGGGSANLVVQNGGTLSGSGSVLGNVVIASGATLNPGNSVDSIDMTGLTLSLGANLQFEFRDASGSYDFGGGDTGPGFSWDLIDLGSGTLNLGNATADNPINFNISAYKLDNSGHALLPGELIFDPQLSYEWLFIQVSNINNLVMSGDDDFSRRFNVVDNLSNGGVFDTGSNNPFTRPSSSAGEGTFTVAWKTGSQGSGLYVQYAAVPEPGSVILAGLASLGAGWYGRRRQKRRAAEAAAQTDAPAA